MKLSDVKHLIDSYFDAIEPNDLVNLAINKYKFPMEQMKVLLWLDDVRNPFEDDWLNFSPIGKNVNVVWVKTQQEFENYINENFLPDGICFDHDLGDNNGDNGDGYGAAKFLVNYCMDNNQNLPKYAIQSANPVGKENINNLLINFKKYQIDKFRNKIIDYVNKNKHLDVDISEIENIDETFYDDLIDLI